MNLLPYRKESFYIGEFDSSVYQILMLVENWKPGTMLIGAQDFNAQAYLKRLIDDGFIEWNNPDDAFIPLSVKLTDKGRERLAYVKERLGIN